MKKLILLCLLIFFVSVSYSATLNSMSKAQFVNAFVDKTMSSIATDNLNGKTINNTFSMYLDNQGHIFGRMSVKPQGEPQTDQGIYSVGSDGAFYITWQHWDNAKKLCGYMYETQNAYLAIGSDGVFHTVFMKADIKAGNHLVGS